MLMQKAELLKEKQNSSQSLTTFILFSTYICISLKSMLLEIVVTKPDQMTCKYVINSIN